MSKDVLVGYKLTEVGMIPEDWEAKTIGEIVTFSGGSQPPRSTFIFKYREGYIRLIQIRDYKTDDFITYIPKDLARKCCSVDDVMIGRYGPPIFQILRGIEGAYNVALIKTVLSQKVDLNYWYYYVQQERLFCLIEGLSQRSSGQTGIDMPSLKAFRFPLPPLPEQEAIARVLSDTDALITSLDKLIAKKRDIKQAAMQQLLEKKDSWILKSFGDAFNFSGGYTASRDQLSTNGFCYLHYGDIHGSKKTFIDVAKEFDEIPKLQVNLRKVSSKSLLNDGDVCFVDASEDDEGTSRHVVIKNSHNITYISGLHTIVAKSKDNLLNNEYKRFCFQSSLVKNQFKFFAVGTKVSGISKTNIAKINIFIPSIEEQQVIAKVLSDMDSEISALEQRRDKTKALKQAMMQELLTGKTRLK